MAKKAEITAFIESAQIPLPQKKGLLTRMNGLVSQSEEDLSPQQVDMIFEGMNHLKEEFLKKEKLP
jgi:hypothetical protein